MDTELWHEAINGSGRQVILASLAETDEVRAVHRALEQLYRTQLAAMELVDRLDRMR